MSPWEDTRRGREREQERSEEVSERKKSEESAWGKSRGNTSR